MGAFDSSEDDPVVVDQEGDGIVVGSSFTGTVDIDGDTFTSVSEHDGVVMVLDVSDGRGFDGPSRSPGGGQTYVNDVAITADGVYVALQFNDDLVVPGGAGVPSCGATLMNPDSADDGALLKLDRGDGTVLWCLPLRTTGDDSADAVVRSDGGSGVWVGESSRAR